MSEKKRAIEYAQGRVEALVTAAQNAAIFRQSAPALAEVWRQEREKRQAQLLELIGGLLSNEN